MEQGRPLEGVLPVSVELYQPQNSKETTAAILLIFREVGFNTENNLYEHISITNINEPVEHGVYEAGGLDRVIAAKEELNGGDVESKDFPKALEESEMEKLVTVLHYLSTTATVTI